MASQDPDLVRYRNDEFCLLEDRARAHGIPFRRPTVERVDATVASGRRISAIRWGTREPEIVLLHGGAQNAHTWDAVALALGRDILCVDLPGHGWSDWRDDHDYRPQTLVDDVAHAISKLAPSARLVTGMSLGGMTALGLAAARPELVRRLALVDITPGSRGRDNPALFNFLDGPESFASVEEIVDRAMRFSPGRSRDSLRIGVLHNAFEGADGRWRWRYDTVIGRPRHVEAVREAMLAMWPAVSAVRAPILLVKGANSPVVSDEAIAEWRRRQPDVRVVAVDGAGHSVQSDKPRELAALLESHLLE